MLINTEWDDQCQIGSKLYHEGHIAGLKKRFFENSLKRNFSIK